MVSQPPLPGELNKVVLAAVLPPVNPLTHRPPPSVATGAAPCHPGFGQVDTLEVMAPGEKPAVGVQVEEPTRLDLVPSTFVWREQRAPGAEIESVSAFGGRTSTTLGELSLACWRSVVGRDPFVDHGEIRSSSCWARMACCQSFRPEVPRIAAARTFCRRRSSGRALVGRTPSAQGARGAGY